jgi:microcystin-dependent protein
MTIDTRDKKTRADLRSYFQTNKIPTEQNFSDFIGSVLNAKDDGIIKPMGDPLSIQASGQDYKPVLNLYEAFSDAKPSWGICLNPATGVKGLAIGTGADGISSGVTRLFMHATTGNVGIGTITPSQKLEVSGNAVVTGSLSVASVSISGSVSANSLTVGGGTANKIVSTISSATDDTTALPTQGAVRALVAAKTTPVSDISSASGSALPSCDAVKTYVNQAIPVGVILMWSGSSIPTGWALCDGTNGTPDLRDRFVVGKSDSKPVHTKGGSASVTLTVGNLPAHTHSVTIQNSGEHLHRFTAYHADLKHAGGATESHLKDDGDGSFNVETNSAGAHSHTASAANTGDGIAHENMPPFYALAFIMRIS